MNPLKFSILRLHITIGVFLYSTVLTAGIIALPQLKASTSIQKTYAVIVAVADYQYTPNQAGGDLKYTDDDARKFYQFICSDKGGKATPQDVALLINRNATKAKILSTLEKVFSIAKKEDRIIFYYSGHGLPGFLIPSDGLSNDQSTLISFDELKEKLKNCKSSTKLCFIDSCNANSIKLGTKKIKKKRNKQLDSNIVIMVSSQSYQYSLENNQLKQGVFSYFLINGLKGKADQNQDKTISITELHLYVYTNVKEYTLDAQIPHTFGNFDKNMPVAILH